MGTTDGVTGLGLPSFGPPPPAPTRYRLGDLVLRLCDVGLACCAVELGAAVQGDPDLVPVDGEDAPHGTEVLVVSGTVSDKSAPSVRQIYDALPDPKLVVSFGSCANSGGPYWDSYCVTKGVDQMIPVDVYVPGCPPRPESLVHALRALAERRP